ncbi:MAG: GMC family oxidoreductase [Pseudomonadales bacterium]|nr:GMC family oxidoreductase [Pseudomonadales bacterium]
MSQHTQNLSSAYDYIVVGGGSAGCVVAGRLAEANLGSVLLLEGADRAEANPETLSADGFKYAFANDKVMLDRMSAEQEHCGKRTLYAGSGRGMGGSGSVNGMVYTRGDKLDFAQWPSGWHWQDIEPAFQGLEQRLRPRHREATGFTELALTAAEAAGFQRKHGMNDGHLNGFMGYNDMNYEGDKRRNSYVAFIAENTSSALTVKTRSLVQKIVFDGQRATAVEVMINGKLHTIQAKKEIVLCAGALETPKLLMLSGVGPKEHLQSLAIPVVHDAPEIGNNLHDHPNVSLFFQGRKPVDFRYPQVYGFTRCNPTLDLPAEQADTCFAWLAAPVTMQQSMTRMAPATLLHGKKFFNPVLKGLIRFALKMALLLPPVNRFINNLYGIVIILGKPLSRGTLRLASRNAKDPAIVDLGYYSNPVDMETMINGVELAKKIGSHEGLKTWGNRLMAPPTRSSKREVLKKWIINTSMTTFHYCGTCTMGEENSAPVDTRLKLKGVQGIRIADASAIPVIPVSALNAPSMMVAYRAADFILQDAAVTAS